MQTKPIVAIAKFCGCLLEVEATCFGGTGRLHWGEHPHLGSSRQVHVFVHPSEPIGRIVISFSGHQGIIILSLSSSYVWCWFFFFSKHRVWQLQHFASGSGTQLVDLARKCPSYSTAWRMLLYDIGACTCLTKRFKFACSVSKNTWEHGSPEKVFLCRAVYILTIYAATENCLF